MKKPVTLQQAIVYFGDQDRAFEYAKWMRWPDDKVTCPRCDSDSNSFVKTRRLWFCNGCKKQFTVKIGTIFEDSPIGLDKWMTAVWMICNCKNGISSYELHRSIGVTQKSAWFMLHRIREAMKSGTFVKMGGSDSGPIVFRFNNRATKDNPLTDEDRFALAMMQAVGRRLTYTQLTGQGAD